MRASNPQKACARSFFGAPTSKGPVFDRVLLHVRKRRTADGGSADAPRGVDLAPAAGGDTLGPAARRPHPRPRCRLWRCSTASWPAWVSRTCASPPRLPKGDDVAERIVRTIGSECLDHLIVIAERHLRAVLTDFAAYYNRGRPPAASACGVSPRPRPWPDRVAVRPGGLHHVYAPAA